MVTNGHATGLEKTPIFWVHVIHRPVYRGEVAVLNHGFPLLVLCNAFMKLPHIPYLLRNVTDCLIKEHNESNDGTQ